MKLVSFMTSESIIIMMVIITTVKKISKHV